MIDVHYFPEYEACMPTSVLVHKFMQLYQNRLRLDNAGITVKSTVRYWPNNSELLARLKETA